MKLAELQKKVTDILGVSISQKELSFEIFIENISEVLGEGITLKVPRIGFFQQRADSSGGDVDQLLFASLPEDFSHEDLNLYLTIDVSPKVKTKLEFDATVFSIGVGKPLLPLTIDELPDTETSYAMLRKSIEERVKELIAESDQIPNFNIWDDYYNSPEDYETEKPDDVQAQLAELTADINYKELTEPQRIPDNLFEDNDKSIVNDEQINIDDQINTNEAELPQDDLIKTATEEDKFSELEKIIKAEEANINLDEYDAVVNKIESDTTTDEEPADYSALEELEVSAGSLTVADLLDDSASIPKENLPAQNEAAEPEISNVPEMPIDKPEAAETGSKFFDLEDIETEKKVPDVEEKEKPPIISGEKEYVSDETDDENLEREEPNDDKIEWNWGDELKDEFGVMIREEDADFEMVDQFSDEDNLELIDEKVGADKKFTKDLFKELEKTLEREIFEEGVRLDEDRHKYSRRLTNERSFRFKKPTDEYSDDPKKVVLEFSGPPVKYEFIEDRKIDRGKKRAITIVDDERRYEDDYNKLRIKPVVKEKDNYFNKTFILIFSAFVIVTSVIIYLIMKGNNPNEPQQTKLEANNSNQMVQSTVDSQKAFTPSETITNQNNSAQNRIVNSQPVNDELSDFPISATPPVPVKQGSALQNQGSRSSANNLRTEPTTKPENGDLYKTPATDTRINKSIYYDGKNYSYQTSSWPRKLRAEQEVKRLRSLGINAFIVEAYLPQKGGTWYRVRVGSFNSEKEAQDYINKNKF